MWGSGIGRGQERNEIGNQLSNEKQNLSGWVLNAIETLQITGCNCHLTCYWYCSYTLYALTVWLLIRWMSRHPVDAHVLKKIALFFLFIWAIQTRETVFHRDIRTKRGKLNIRRAAEYFWRDSRCLDSRSWMEHCRVFHTSSQPKQKLRCKESTPKNKIVKIYANLRWFLNLLHR